MNIVLYKPQIPQNTGNIARTCVATNSTMHIILPIGFSLEDKYLKRAGLDYWEDLNIFTYENFLDFYKNHHTKKMYFLSTKGLKNYTKIDYKSDDYLIFGNETEGLPEVLLKKFYDRTIRIPMKSSARSLNLSNSVALVLYEALRQNSFEGLLKKGEVTNRVEKYKNWFDL